VLVPSPPSKPSPMVGTMTLAPAPSSQEHSVCRPDCVLLFCAQCGRHYSTDPDNRVCPTNKGHAVESVIKETAAKVKAPDGWGWNG
jgi:hypothetical protein